MFHHNEGTNFSGSRSVGDSSITVTIGTVTTVTISDPLGDGIPSPPTTDLDGNLFDSIDEYLKYINED